MTFRFRRRFVPDREGTYSVRLQGEERQLLATLSADLGSIVESDPDDPALKRLFPTAYPKDPEREQEWRLLMSVDLHDSRRAQLAMLAATAEATTLTEEELLAWTQAMNDLRLYLGTRLEVSEETELEDFEDEESQLAYAVYSLLAMLQEDAVDALSQSL